jgi:D-proline reductase (dithiol) PrdB
MISALDNTQSVNPPRAAFLNFPLGDQAGKPHQPELQRQIVRDAMKAFETIDRPGTIVQLPYIWDPIDRTWE